MLKTRSWAPVMVFLAVALILPVPCPGADRAAAAGSPAAVVQGDGYRLIQQIAVPNEVANVYTMKVKSDGSQVLYTALLKDSVEGVLLVNTTRLTNTLLDAAKQTRAKTGDQRIPVEPGDYAFALINDVAVSPFDDPIFQNGAYAGVSGGWGWVAYYVTTQGAGPFILVNELKPPDFRPLNFAAGAFPSFLHIAGSNKEIAFWTQSGDRIVLMIGREQAVRLDVGVAPAGPALFFRGAPPVNLAFVAGAPGKGRALYLGGRKVSPDYEGLEPALNPEGQGVGYIAKLGPKSMLFINGKEQATGFAPAHGLAFFAGGNACAFAAASGGREYVVKNGLKTLGTFARVTKDRDFAHVTDLAFDSKAAKVAYVAADHNKEWIMVDDRPVTPEFDRVAFNREAYEWGGPLVFAGYDAAKRAIVVGKI
jgi:hypothetical protein